MLSAPKLSCIALLVVGLLSWSGASAEPAGLTIDISPASGPAGTTVTISGGGAAPSATIDVLWSPWFSGEACGPQPRGAELVAQVTADSQGQFSATHQAKLLPNYGNATWQGVIYLAKTSTAGSEVTSNYVCFRFTGATSPDVQYFPETGHSVGHGFLRFWQQFGGLAVFGYPISGEFQEHGLTVQYFERARFEWHPGVDPSHYDVLLGLLGNEVTQGRVNEGPFISTTANSSMGCTYYAATGHNLCGGFAAYWTRFGGLAVYGYPISEEFQEKNPDSGQIDTVQYFQRGRFEWHLGEWPTRYDVELGRLGAEILQGQKT